MRSKFEEVETKHTRSISDHLSAIDAKQSFSCDWSRVQRRIEAAEKELQQELKQLQQNKVE